MLMLARLFTPVVLKVHPIHNHHRRRMPRLMKARQSFLRARLAVMVRPPQAL